MINFNWMIQDTWWKEQQVAVDWILLSYVSVSTNRLYVEQFVRQVQIR